MPVAPPPPVDNRKYLHSLPKIPWGTKSPGPRTSGLELALYETHMREYYRSLLLLTLLTPGDGWCSSFHYTDAETRDQWYVQGHRAGLSAKLWLESVISPKSFFFYSLFMGSLFHSQSCCLQLEIISFLLFPSGRFGTFENRTCTARIIAQVDSVICTEILLGS